MFIVRWPSGVTRIIERAVGAPTSAGGRGELDAGRRQVVAVEVAELVGRDLADEAGASAERGNARRGIAGRSAADLARRAHMRRRAARPPPRRSAASTLGHALRCKKVVVGVGDHVDDGIADAQDVEARSVMQSPGLTGKRAPSRAFSRRRNLASASSRAAHRHAHAPHLALALRPAPRRLRHAAADPPPAPQPPASPPQPRAADAARGLTAQRAGRPIRQARAADPRGHQPQAPVPRPRCVLDAYLYPSRNGRASRDPCRHARAVGRRQSIRRPASPRSNSRKLIQRPARRFGDHRVRVVEVRRDRRRPARDRRCCPPRSGSCGSSA